MERARHFRCVAVSLVVLASACGSKGDPLRATAPVVAEVVDADSSIPIHTSMVSFAEIAYWTEGVIEGERSHYSDPLIASSDPDDWLKQESERPEVSLQEGHGRKRLIVDSVAVWWERTFLILEWDRPIDDCDSAPIKIAAYRFLDIGPPLLIPMTSLGIVVDHSDCEEGVVRMAIEFGGLIPSLEQEESENGDGVKPFTISTSFSMTLNELPTVSAEFGYFQVDEQGASKR